MLKEFILSLLILTPNHELNRDPELLDEVTSFAKSAGAKYGLEPSLIIYYAYRESSLNTTAVGDLGEQGYCQAHGTAQKTCKAAGYSITDRRDGLHCIGLLIDMGRRKCGSLLKGVIWYASGNCKGSNLTKKKMKQRLKTWEKRWEQFSQ